MKPTLRFTWAVPALAGVALLFLVRSARPGDLRLDLTIVSNRTAQLTLRGDSNALNTVLTSSNLASWLAWTNVFNDTGVIQVLDSTFPDELIRFYRATQEAFSNARPFNTTLDFNLSMENAANPSCGCNGQPAYSQGISLTGERCAECEGAVAIPGIAQDTGGGQVFLHNGELVHRAVDLEIASRGIPWRLERIYRSGLTFDGPLGRNWEFSHNRRLVVEPNGNVLRMDGSGRADRYLAQTNGSYAAPRGFYTRLIKQPDGSFTERDRHGALVEYSAPGSNSVARMTAVRDRNGNTMRFEYDGLDRLVRAYDTFGRQIDYHYDSGNRLTEVQDFTGRKVTYQYDGSGDLISVTSPVVTNTPNGNDYPTGKTTRYTYSSGASDERLNHNLLTITAPNEVVAGGPPRVVLEYDTNAASPDLDRLLRLTLGGTNASGVAAGGMILYRYQPFGSAPSNDFATAVFQTTATDRNGNLAEYQFNQLGNVVRVREFSNRDVRPSDPAFFETRFEYNGDGEMTRAIYPEGNSVEFTYDTANPDRFQQGNRLQVRRVPDAARGGDQAQLVTTRTYEPLFNQLRTKTEPRGNDAAYVPPNGGTNSPARYTTTLYYDYQEAATAPAAAAAFEITIPPALLGWGDLNGDGRTDQAGGNLVRRDDPTVNLLPGSNQALAEGSTHQQISWRFTYNRFGQLTQTEDPRGNLDLVSYFPENDPDGDGADLITGRNSVTGGYLAQTVRDAFAGSHRQDPLPPVAITNRLQLDRRGNPVAVTDGRGAVTRFTYNALNQIVQKEQPKADASQATGYLRRYLYDANNNRVGVNIQNVTTDPTNHLPLLVAGHPFFQHRYTYDILDRLLEETRDATRDPSLAPSSQPELLATRYRHDANQNLIRTFSPLAVSGAEPDNYESVTYNERDLRHTVTRGGASPQASTWTYDYDRNGNVVRWTDAQDNDATPGPESEVTDYDGFDRRRTVVDRAGNEQRSAYDPAGRKVRAEFFGPAAAGSSSNVLLRSVSSRYDELGRLFQVDRPLFVPAGVSLHTNVDLTDGPLTPRDMTVSERHEYDANNRLTFQVKDNGAVFQQVYDGAGRLISKVLPQVDTVTPGGPYRTRSDFTYDASGNLVRQTDTLSNPHGKGPPQVVTRLMVYDALNRLVRETDPDGHSRYAEFDSRNNQVSTYDARGPLRPDPLGIYTSGNINDRGNATRYAYDGLGRAWQQTIELTTTGEGGAPLNTTNTYNPDGLITLRTSYDANDRMVSRADDKTNTQFYAYDVLNRQVAITNADGGWRAWTFDRDDNRTSLRDENNTLHTYTYDGINRLRAHALSLDATKTNVAGLPLLVGTTLQTFDYDGLSSLVRSFDNNNPATTNDDWTVAQAYDSLGRVLEDNQNGRAVNSGYTAYNRTTLHYPNGRVVHRTFDGFNQLVHLANYNELAVDIEPLGPCARPLQCAFSIPVVGLLATDSRSFNNEGLVTGIQQTCGSNTVDSFTFDRNRNNDVVAFQRLAPLGALIHIDYDSAGRMISFTSGTNTVQTIIDGAQNYRQLLDALGNVLQILNVNAVNELIALYLLYGNSPSTGIRTRDPNFIYQWDGLNRLRVVRQRATPGNIVAVYTYDAQPAIYGGRRVQKTVSNSGALNGTTRFYYDGANAIEETTVSGGSEKVVRQFIFGTKPDEVFAMDVDTNGDGDPDALYFYLRDHNNNTTQLLARNGSNAVPYELYSYNFRGAPAVFDASTRTNRPSSAAGNPYLFTGQRYDAETGLYYYKARYYDSYFGVFLSRDPLGLWGERRNHGNAMAYTGNNPWNHRDPSGLRLYPANYNDWPGPGMGSSKAEDPSPYVGGKLQEERMKKQEEWVDKCTKELRHLRDYCAENFPDRPPPRDWPSGAKTLEGARRDNCYMVADDWYNDCVLNGPSLHPWRGIGPWDLFPSSAPPTVFARIAPAHPTCVGVYTEFETPPGVAAQPPGATPLQDKFPIMFANDSPLSGPPRQPNVVTVGIRSYGQCASGSCSESTLPVEGTSGK